MWIIALTTIAFTSLLSGVLGMGGGLILMGVLAFIMPLSQSMILHGLTQWVANYSRAHVHRKAIHWSTFCWYVPGSLITLVVFFFLTLTLSKPWFFISLGTLAFSSFLVPKQIRIEVTRPGNALLCGVLVTACHLLVGVAGPVLDLFFIRADLSRYQVLATKAATQAVGHSAKLIFWSGAVFSAIDQMPFALWVLPAAVVLAIGGSYFGAKILSKMDDTQFRRLTSLVLSLIGLVYVVKGGLMLV